MSQEMVSTQGQTIGSLSLHFGDCIDDNWLDGWAAVLMTQPDLLRSARSLPSSYTCPASARQNILLNHIRRFSVGNSQSCWLAPLKKIYHTEPRRANYHLHSLINCINKRKDSKSEGCNLRHSKVYKTNCQNHFLPSLNCGLNQRVYFSKLNNAWYLLS